jgi:hypothetical protein
MVHLDNLNHLNMIYQRRLSMDARVKPGHGGKEAATLRHRAHYAQ